MVDCTDIQKAKKIANIRSIERRERLEAFQDYLGFAVAKITGLSFLMTGAIEKIQPDFLTVTVSNPEILIGLGLSLLVGPKIVNMLAKIFKALEKL